MHSKYCSSCGIELEKNRIGKQRYCKECHNAYMRETRCVYRLLPEEEKKKSIVRAKLNVALRRGRVEKPVVCSVCSKDGRLEAHHADYAKPYDVVWVCRKCHIMLHKKEKQALLSNDA